MNGFTLDLHADLTTHFGGEVDSTEYTGSFYITESATESTAYTTQLHAAETDVVNDTEDPVQVQVVREVLSAPEGWEFSMCYGLCFSPDIDTIQFSLFGGYEAEFTLYTYPEGVAGESEVLLTFTNMNDTENSYDWLVSSSSDYVTVADHQIALFGARWHPTKFTVELVDDQVAHIRLYDLMGRTIASTANSNSLALDPAIRGWVCAHITTTSGKVYMRKTIR